MNRIVKYRGRRKDNGEWVYGVPIKNSFGEATLVCVATIDQLAYPMERLHEFCFEVDPKTVSQYTGVKDKHGVEIYEGDCLKSGKAPVVEVVYISYAFKLRSIKEFGEVYNMSFAKQAVFEIVDKPLGSY